MKVKVNSEGAVETCFWILEGPACLAADQQLRSTKTFTSIHSPRLPSSTNTNTNVPHRLSIARSRLNCRPDPIGLFQQRLTCDHPALDSCFGATKSPNSSFHPFDNGRIQVGHALSENKRRR